MPMKDSRQLTCRLNSWIRLQLEYRAGIYYSDTLTRKKPIVPSGTKPRCNRYLVQHYLYGIKRSCPARNSGSKCSGCTDAHDFMDARMENAKELQKVLDSCPSRIEGSWIIPDIHTSAMSATEDDSGVMTGLGVLSGCTLAAFKDRANWNDDDGIPG
ncbi:uncharacterized protein BO96DRAFT_343889 [Aspergillus niger CBS 101883]|uniref:Contig An14c0180, genomic contig n=2 Tax=Aspergillus niger TaxID=5061 RepID=A2R3W3_ASPNC|nr:uncharacterized protein BO96DRAFT_343889 [Aspergillus niger CBS 101883]XP_059602374.1 uncharacterized protein An14g05700 [Aspergillus niger]PYH54079.1 hypothetical protein BO96DRAFT_343889 [Aspergillus niger CBS 101883]CAK42131.1 unnamed protein product [Aspergillus niger]